MANNRTGPDYKDYHKKSQEDAMKKYNEQQMDKFIREQMKKEHNKRHG